jgi:thiaminase/transcriptional activator TenA
MTTSYRAWAADRDEARFTDWLRAGAEPTWSRAVDHRFTRELAAGNLADDVMRGYLVQDYVFLDSFVRLVASAVVKAPSLADRLPLGRFLGVVTSEENTYFQRAFGALGVGAGERSGPTLRPPTRGFLDVMADAVAAEDYATTITPLVVFEWLYLAWASTVSDRLPDGFVHREWITIHANPAFAAFVEWLRGQLDRHGPTLPDAQQDRLAGVFRHTVELELQFFDDAYLPR